MISDKSVHENESNSLQITVKGTQKLSKLQEQFNSLIRKIAKLEKDIETESEKMNSILAVYSKDVSPLKKDVALYKMKLAAEFDAAFHTIKFAKKYDKDFEFVITNLMDDAFHYITPNKEQEQLYDRWAKISYKEEIDNAEESVKEMAGDLLKKMFDIDIDMSKYENSAEGQAQFQRDMEEIINKKKANKNHSFSSKSKKQQEKLLAQKADDELKSRNIRSIYIALAKILHPDSETDMVLKLEKEELMKKVTVAYEQKDLSTLLKLELEWVHKTNEHLETLTEEKLKIYISALKEQAKELEQERITARKNPRFQEICDFANYQESTALKEIKRLKKVYKTHSEVFSALIISIKNNQDKKAIIPILTTMAEQYEIYDIDPFDDFYF